MYQRYGPERCIIEPGERVAEAVADAYEQPDRGSVDAHRQLADVGHRFHR